MPLAPLVRLATSHRLDPGNFVIHGAGQSPDAFADYCRALPAGLQPRVYMCYVGLRGGRVADFFARLRVQLAEYPQNALVPQIGLSMTRDGFPDEHYEQEVAAGKHDEAIGQFVAGLGELGRPAFVRIGYEFNGHWNGYVAETYKTAFRRVTAAIREAKLDQVATVWCFAPEGRNEDFMSFYPGDDVVDWWAIDPFDVEHFSAPVTERFMAAADKAGYPVMIGETTPRRVGVLGGQASWDKWFVPYFRFIHEHRTVKATCYISWDWSKYPAWADWGDGQIWRNPVVLAHYREAMADPLFLHAAR